MKKLSLLGLTIVTLATAAAQAADAKAIYEKECTKCHGVDGKGNTKTGKKLGAKDYTDPKFQETLKDEKMFKVIKEGLKENDTTKMKPLENVTDAEIKALVAHMRAFKGK